MESNIEWINKLSEDKKLNEGDIIYLVPNKKFGIFKNYGKKEDRIWCNMYKQKSMNIMSKSWVIKLSLCEVAFKLENGELVNQNPEKFVMNGKIPMLKEEKEKLDKKILEKKEAEEKKAAMSEGVIELGA